MDRETTPQVENFSFSEAEKKFSSFGRTKTFLKNLWRKLKRENLISFMMVLLSQLDYLTTVTLWPLH